MQLLQNFREKAKTLNALIHMCRLHTSDGPVNLERAFDHLNIEVKGGPDPEGFHGVALAIHDKYEITNYKILINKTQSSAMQRKTKGHELGHLINHMVGNYPQSRQTCFSMDSQPYTADEFDADCIAAYLLVPAGYFLYAAAHGWSETHLATELDVPIELVRLRVKMAIELDELRDW